MGAGVTGLPGIIALLPVEGQHKKELGYAIALLLNSGANTAITMDHWIRIHNNATKLLAPVRLRYIQ